MPDIHVSLDSLPFDALCASCGRPVNSELAIRRETWSGEGRVCVSYLDFGCWIGEGLELAKASNESRGRGGL